MADVSNPKSLVAQHIERCIESYSGQCGSYGDVTSAESYEIMRADLMLAIGMLSALARLTQEGK